MPSDPWIENNDTTICEGNSVNLAADGALYYEWTPHDGLDDPYSQYPVATPNITTTYYLTGYGESCNLIYNGDFSGGYDGFYTVYNYSPNLIPEGNFYIGDNPSNYHYNFASCADHTTGSGNMMIVNGSPVANEEIWCQDIIVLPNTDYVFSTWLTSAHFSNPAVLQFSINGTLLGSPFPATSTSCEWNQFYATWNSGANTNITICIVNQNTIADGNDFAIDDIYFSPICPNYGADSVKITVNPNPTPVLPPNTNACSYDLPYTLDVGNGYPDYAWNTGATTQTIDINTTGNYSVTVTDGNGCTNETSSSFVVNPIPDITTVVSSDYNGQDISCYGFTDGTAEVQHNSGTPPYLYQWDSPAGNQTTQEATNLGPGTYYVTITDGNGCTIEDNISLVEPPQLDATTSVTSNYNGQDVSCNGFTDGSAEAIPTDGTPPYTYLWDASTGNQTTQEATNLGAGTYYVTITDINGCSIVRDIILSEPLSLDVNISTVDVICGSSLGSATAHTTGATPGYSYLWSNGSQNQTATGLIVEEYTVTVTDINGCSAFVSANVQPIGNLNISFTLQEPVSCHSYTDAALLSHVNNGVPEFEYNWSNGTNQSAITNVGAGNYTLSVTDSWGCFGVNSYYIDEPPQIVLHFITNDVLCYADSNGSASVLAGGGYPPYTYDWVTGETNTTISNLVAGSYPVSVTDTRECTVVGEAIIMQPDKLNVQFEIDSINCYGETGAIQANVSGGTNPYEYIWTYLGYTFNDQTIVNIQEGVYSLNVTDRNSCSFDTLVNMLQPEPLTGTFVFDRPSCIGNWDGSIDIILEGGTATYYSNPGIVDAYHVYLDGLYEGEYEFNIVDYRGCELTIGPVVLIDIQVECLTIPNAFTPNGDGVNDTWQIENIHMYPGAQIQIFNRWGQILWVGDPSTEWDGTYEQNPVPTGTYIYVINLYNGDEPRIGNITVVY